VHIATNVQSSARSHITTGVCKSYLYPATRLSTCLSAAVYSIYSPLCRYFMPYMNVQGCAVCQICVNVVKYCSREHLYVSSIRNGPVVLGVKALIKSRYNKKCARATRMRRTVRTIDYVHNWSQALCCSLPTHWLPGTHYLIWALPCTSMHREWSHLIPCLVILTVIECHPNLSDIVSCCWYRGWRSMGRFCSFIHHSTTQSEIDHYPCPNNVKERHSSQTPHTTWFSSSRARVFMVICPLSLQLRGWIAWLNMTPRSYSSRIKGWAWLHSRHYHFTLITFPCNKHGEHLVAMFTLSKLTNYLVIGWSRKIRDYERGVRDCYRPEHGWWTHCHRLGAQWCW
jgi:hypothetical protein